MEAEEEEKDEDWGGGGLRRMRIEDRGLRTEE